MSPAVITLLVLLVMVVFFVTEKLPAALVAMLGGSVLVLCGIIDPAELFSAFSGSTIVLVAAMMVVGSALFHTGIAAKMADVLVKFTGTSENGIMIAFMLVATIISAVCSGVAVVAMLLPIVISVSQRAGVSVSRQLIPMSFAASFGCNLTLMGAGQQCSGQRSPGGSGRSHYDLLRTGQSGHSGLHCWHCVLPDHRKAVPDPWRHL